MVEGRVGVRDGGMVGLMWLGKCRSKGFWNMYVMI